MTDEKATPRVYEVTTLRSSREGEIRRLNATLVVQAADDEAARMEDWAARTMLDQREALKALADRQGRIGVRPIGFVISIMAIQDTLSVQAGWPEDMDLPEGLSAVVVKPS